MTREPRNPPDPGRAWDELYGAPDPEVLPPPPLTPKKRRFRRRLLLSLTTAALLVGGVAFAAHLAIRSVSDLMQAIGEGDTEALMSQVNWPVLQSELQGQMTAMARDAQIESLGGATPPPSTQAYLGGLVDSTVTAQSNPVLLASTIRNRVFAGPQRAYRRRGASLLPEIGPLHLPGGGLVQLDFPGDPTAFPAGISLCLRLQGSVAMRFQLIGLGWPETNRGC
jgi:hypothetical protein